MKTGAALFFGKDKNGNVRQCSERATDGTPNKKDTYGSDRSYCFFSEARVPCTSVSVFESAIDLMSFATIMKRRGLDFRRFHKIGNWGLKETRKSILKWRNRPKKFKVNAQQPKQLPAPKRPALPSVKATAKTAQKGVKTAQQTAKAATKTAKVTIKAGQRAAQAAKAAAKATVKFAKFAAKAVVAAVKATVVAVKGIVAAIAAGGWIVVVVILLICMIGLVVGSVFGIFAPNPDNENGITIVQTVREANAEYEAQIAGIKSRYDYDMCFVTGNPCEWSLAIAVYAVKTNRTEDVVTFDEAKAEVLKEIYRRLNRMDVHTEQIAVKETHLETQEDGSVVPVEQEVVKTYLYIDTVSLTAEEAANLYGFDKKQREQLGELLSDKNKEMWDALLPGLS